MMWVFLLVAAWVHSVSTAELHDCNAEVATTLTELDASKPVTIQSNINVAVRFVTESDVTLVKTAPSIAALAEWDQQLACSVDSAANALQCVATFPEIVSGPYCDASNDKGLAKGCVCEVDADCQTDNCDDDANVCTSSKGNICVTGSPGCKCDKEFGCFSGFLCLDERDICVSVEEDNMSTLVDKSSGPGRMMPGIATVTRGVAAVLGATWLHLATLVSAQVSAPGPGPAANGLPCRTENLAGAVALLVPAGTVVNMETAPMKSPSPSVESLPEPTVSWTVSSASDVSSGWTDSVAGMVLPKAGSMSLTPQHVENTSIHSVRLGEDAYFVKTDGVGVLPQGSASRSLVLVARVDDQAQTTWGGFNYGTSASLQTFGLVVADDGALWFDFRDTKVVGANVKGTGWFVAVGVYDGATKTATLYQNELAPVTISDVDLNTGSSQVRVARSFSNKTTEVDVAAINVFDRVLTPMEVTDIVTTWTSWLAGPSSPVSNNPGPNPAPNPGPNPAPNPGPNPAPKPTPQPTTPKPTPQPTTPKPTSLPPASTVTVSHGALQWTFSGVTSSGVDLNGLPWVAGNNVRLTAVPATTVIDGEPGSGTTINPQMNGEQSWDSRIKKYVPATWSLPLTLQPGDVVVSVISVSAVTRPEQRRGVFSDLGACFVYSPQTAPTNANHIAPAVVSWPGRGVPTPYANVDLDALLAGFTTLSDAATLDVPTFAQVWRGVGPFNPGNGFDRGAVGGHEYLAPRGLHVESNYGRYLAQAYGAAALALLLPSKFTQSERRQILGKLIEVGVQTADPIVGSKVLLQPDGGINQFQLIPMICAYLATGRAGSIGNDVEAYMQGNYYGQPYIATQEDVDYQLNGHRSSSAPASLRWRSVVSQSNGGLTVTVETAQAYLQNDGYRLNVIGTRMRRLSDGQERQVTDVFIGFSSDRYQVTPNGNGTAQITIASAFQPALTSADEVIFAGNFNYGVGQPMWGIRHTTARNRDYPQAPKATYRDLNFYADEVMFVRAAGVFSSTFVAMEEYTKYCNLPNEPAGHDFKDHFDALITDEGSVHFSETMWQAHATTLGLD